MNPATSTFKTNATFTPREPTDKAAAVGTGEGTNPTMELLGDYMIEGGGATCVIGASKITIGNVGNLTSDTFTVNYPVPNPVPPSPGSEAGTAREEPGVARNPDGTIPVMVDTSRVGRGGEQAFRGRSKEVPQENPPTGRRVKLSSRDKPGFGGWRINHPQTGNLWATTYGGVSFREFVVAFPKNFPRTYSSLNENTWTIVVTGKNDGHEKWESDSPTITGNDEHLTAVQHNVQVLGPSYFHKYFCVYAPGEQKDDHCVVN
jgi:hypothetical protein